ncbi:hypothetical protein DFH11DRAFT_1613933, partial [Phellopilus nigrolimitatus]
SSHVSPNESPAPRKRDERPLDIVSRRGIAGWCKQSVERLPSRQSHHRLEAIPDAEKLEHVCSYRSTSVRSLRAKCTEAASEEKSDGSILETWGRLAPHVRLQTVRLFEHRRLSIVLRCSQLVTYQNQKLLLAFASTLLCLPDKSLEASASSNF